MGLDGVVGCHLVLGIFVWGFGAWVGVGKSGVGLGIVLVFRRGGLVWDGVINEVPYEWIGSI